MTHSLDRTTMASLAVLLAASCASVGTDPDLGSSPQAAIAAESIQVFYTTPTNDFATADSSSTIGPIEAGIIQSFDNAASSLDIAIYELSRQNLVDAILRAKARGVTVRVVTECENRKGEDQPFFDQLTSAGIPVVDDNSSFNGANPLSTASTTTSTRSPTAPTPSAPRPSRRARSAARCARSARIAAAAPASTAIPGPASRPLGVPRRTS